MEQDFGKAPLAALSLDQSELARRGFLVRKRGTRSLGMKGKRTFWRAIGGAAVIALFGLAAMACDTGGGSAAIANGGGGGSQGGGGGIGGGYSIYGTWEVFIPEFGGIVTVVMRPDGTWTSAIPALHLAESGIFTRTNATTARLFVFDGWGYAYIGTASVITANTATVTLVNDTWLLAAELAGRTMTLIRVGSGGTQQITITQIPAHYQGMYMYIMLGGTNLGTVATGSSPSPSNSATFGLQLGGNPVVVHGEFDILLTISLDGGHAVRYRILARNIAAGSSAIPFSAFGSPVPSISVTVNGIPQQYQDSGARISLHVPGTGAQRAVSNGVWVSGSSVTLNMVNWFTPLTTTNYEIRLEFAENWNWGTGAVYNITRNLVAVGINTIDFVGNFNRMPEINVTITGIPNRYHDDWGDLDLHIPSNAARTARAEVRVTGPEATFRFVGVAQGNHDVVLWLNDFGARYALSSSWNIYNGVSIPFSAFSLVPQSLSAETGSAELTSPAPRERR